MFNCKKAACKGLDVSPQRTQFANVLPSNLDSFISGIKNMFAGYTSCFSWKTRCLEEDVDGYVRGVIIGWMDPKDKSLVNGTSHYD